MTPKWLFSVGVLAFTAAIGVYFSGNTPSHEVPPDFGVVAREDAKPFAKLISEHGIVKITSLTNGKTVAMKPSSRFFANNSFHDQASDLSSSELLIEDRDGEVLLLESSLAELSDDVIADFASLPAVSAAEENLTGELFAEQKVKKQPAKKSQSASNILDKIARNDSPENEVLVAIIDSGIDKNHPAFSGKIWQNEAEKRGKPRVDDDGNGLIDDIDGWNFAEGNGNITDTFGHGTHVSGIIAAKKTPIHEMTGVNPLGTELMILKAAGADKSLKLSNVIAALQFVKDKKPDIVNMSFGFPKESAILRSAIRQLVDQGIFVVAAAGNNSSDEKQFPAAYPEVISVGAANVGGGRYKTSNYGEWIDVSVPGKMFSTLPRGSYGAKSGTSQAAALVTGLLSASLAYAPALSHPEYDSLIKSFGNNFTSDAFLRSKTSVNSPWAKSAVQILKSGHFPDSREQKLLDLHKVITFEEASGLLLDYFELQPNTVKALQLAASATLPEVVAPNQLVRAFAPIHASAKNHYLSESEMQALIEDIQQAKGSGENLNRVNSFNKSKNQYISREKFLDMLFQVGK